MNELRHEYVRRADQRRLTVEQQQKLFVLVGNLRLAAGISAVALAFFVFGNTALSPLWLVLPAGTFLVLVVIHARVVERLTCAQRALRFYERCLARIEDRWMGQGEQGERYRDPKHVYADDLDIFGKGSLYELLCTARTRAGEDILARWLLEPASLDEAKGRQEAIAELAPRLELREQLALLGEDIRGSLHAESIVEWGKRSPVSFPPGLPIIAGLLSAATTVSLLCALAGLSSRVPVLVFVLVQLGLSLYLRPRVRAVVEAVEMPSRDLGLLAALLKRLETEPAHSRLLQQLKQRLEVEGLPASAQIEHLERLATRLDWSHNEFFKPVAALLMWSTQLAVAIERWRQHSGRAISEWITVGGEFEVLCAFAAYADEHRDDPFPELLDHGAEFDGTQLGHPLLPGGQSVRNDVCIGARLPVLVVSGSNMSGKSTLLRTVGLNCVLAWAGAPVRAQRLSVSPLQVGASIRVQDSLQDGKSRFYAEITRLRQLVELTAGSRPVLFLLDELLSGTNSHDRRIGAAAIVRSLLDRGAIGMLTTHDLALAHIADSMQPPGCNVHFADTIKDGRLHFDYHLMPGVVERSNALELMRSVGLEV